MHEFPEIAPLLPDSCAVMVLPEVALFPHHRIPLRIFEPQYRAMLDDALATNRMFALAMTADNAGDEDQNFEEIGGIGLIRACVKADDGTSQLVLQGLSRVRFSGAIDRRPYRWSDIEPFPSSLLEPSQATFWQNRLRQAGQHLAERQPHAFHALGEICRLELDPELQSDLIGGALPMAKALSLRLLKEPVVERRLEWLAKITEALIANFEQS